MDKEKEIEDRHDIASIINGCLRDGYCTASHLARRITQAGYGNIKKAVKGFAEKLKSELWKLDGSWQYIDGEELCETVDDLITELYGADE